MSREGAEIIHCSGRRVCLRRLQLEDRLLLQEFLARIDPDDLQMRFFAGFRSVPPNSGPINRPRTLGLRFSYKFGGR